MIRTLATHDLGDVAHMASVGSIRPASETAFCGAGISDRWRYLILVLNHVAGHALCTQHRRHSLLQKRLRRAQGTFATGDWRNAIRNPGFWQWNLALFNAFKLPVNEVSRTEFGAEAFNFVNHANWGGVDSNPVSSTFMMVTSKTDNRNVQFELKLSF
jgi:hypothetical protein